MKLPVLPYLWQCISVRQFLFSCLITAFEGKQVCVCVQVYQISRRVHWSVDSIDLSFRQKKILISLLAMKTCTLWLDNITRGTGFYRIYMQSLEYVLPENSLDCLFFRGRESKLHYIDVFICICKILDYTDINIYMGEYGRYILKQIFIPSEIIWMYDPMYVRCERRCSLQTCAKGRAQTLLTLLLFFSCL